MDVQVILVFILAILTIALVAVAFYVVMVLKELRNTIKKSNAVLDNVHSVTNSVTNPVNTIMGIVSGISQGFKAVKSITTLRGDLNDDEDREESKNVRKKY